MSATPKIDYQDDWVGALKALTYQQFRKSPKMLAWAAMLGRQAQDLENAMQALLTIRNIEDSEGAQLDNLGRLVGQPRAGIDDATYRLYLRARLVARRSNGTGEAIYAVFRALFTSPTMLLQTSGVGVKAFVLRLFTPITPTQLNVALDFLHDAKESGARALLEWQSAPVDAVMRWDVASAGWDTFPMGGANSA